ncbi:hypothetical protein IW262DRAFT_1496942 [Armillaria fumosa]|nr:hypothetical protein IW262DRAFT_1496942 [Armillaria fumosa]
MSIILGSRTLRTCSSHIYCIHQSTVILALTDFSSILAFAGRAELGLNRWISSYRILAWRRGTMRKSSGGREPCVRITSVHLCMMSKLLDKARKHSGVPRLVMFASDLDYRTLIALLVCVSPGSQFHARLAETRLCPEISDRARV